MTSEELKKFLNEYFVFTIEKSGTVEENSKIYSVDEEECSDFIILEKEIPGIRNLRLNSEFYEEVVNLKIGEKKISIFPLKNKANERRSVLIKGINEIGCGEIIAEGTRADFFTKEFILAFYPETEDRNFFVEEILNNILSDFEKR